jgi:hypothetical protein
MSVELAPGIAIVLRGVASMESRLMVSDTGSMLTFVREETSEQAITVGSKVSRRSPTFVQFIGTAKS